jgi:KDO2-lipid IV(A) lauroyltransferase
MKKEIKYIVEAVVVKAVYYAFKALPISVASDIGGAMGRKIGPKLKVTKLAEKNIRNALPELNDAQVAKTLDDMWDNLGRLVGEFPKIYSISSNNFNQIVEVEGLENLEKAVKSGKATFVFSGHLGNWEALPRLVSENNFPDISLIYRKANNHYVDRLIIKTRNDSGAQSIPKGSVGARYLVNAIKRCGVIMLLVDQKQNDGISVPFFHKEAMTAPAIANLTLKYGCNVLPFQVIRQGGAKFKIKIWPPVEFEKTGDGNKDTLEIMTKINKILEGFIRENPGQWFWVHNRWPK